VSDFFDTLVKSFKCKCPRCHDAPIFNGLFKFEPQDKCPSCGLNLAANDNADGPAVFLIFILGFTVVPLALWVDSVFETPLIIHVIVWSVLLVGLILGTLKPIKSYIMALQYRYRPESWEEE